MAKGIPGSGQIATLFQLEWQIIVISHPHRTGMSHPPTVPFRSRDPYTSVPVILPHGTVPTMRMMTVQVKASTTEDHSHGRLHVNFNVNIFVLGMMTSTARIEDRCTKSFCAVFQVCVKIVYNYINWRLPSTMTRFLLNCGAKHKV